jgi:hypothetical protein
MKRCVAKDQTLDVQQRYCRALSAVYRRDGYRPPYALQREFFIDYLLARIHQIIVMIR